MTEAQRRYFLTEQLKSIKKELGMERDDKDAIIEKYRKKLAEYPEVPKEVMETIESELEKFSTLEKNSPEFNVTRSYLDWLVGVPWGVATDVNYNIKKARQVLNRDHYGLDDVKDAILQFIAIGKLKGTVQGKILCLSGPPGKWNWQELCSFMRFHLIFHIHSLFLRQVRERLPLVGLSPMPWVESFIVLVLVVCPMSAKSRVTVGKYQ